MKPGDVILGNRFRIVHRLGGGGMSEVYLADQVSLRRKVALKVLRREAGDRFALAERFRREAELLAAVEHPAVVRVIDFIESEEATCLVLELAEGETLDSLLQRGKLRPPCAVRLLAQLAEGLAAIHARGILHRDLKPQNVALAPTTRGLQARLLDFGIAKLAESEGDPSVSQPGQVVGTPAYLSPEQCAARPLDTRSDVYAFGVLAYRALTGKLPFQGPTPHELMVQHLFARPNPLEEVAPELRSHPELCTLVARCLEKNPSRRPVSGSSLLRQLAALPAPKRERPLASEPSFATPAWLWSKPVGKGRLSERLSARAFVLRRRLTRALSSALATLSPRVHRPAFRRKQLAAAALLLAFAPAVWAVLPRSLPSRAAALLREGRAGEALTLVDAALPTATAQAPDLYAIKAAALHRLERHAEEELLLREHRHQALFSAHPLLLDALAEDFAEREGDEVLAELIALVPKEALFERFSKSSRGGPSRRQWGALRYLDVAGAGGVEWAERYAASLESLDCEVRAAAARRLGELGDPEAIPSLRELSESPKEERSGKGCGQDEAADAIRALKRR
ncbi:MAG: protein kinase [Myxococcales bacterium]|nr:protein kinase [Myxococcales bacterium]